MRGDGGAEPFECMPGHRVQVGEQLLGVLEAEDRAVGGGGVRAIEDRLVDVREVDSAKPAAARMLAVIAGSARENGPGSFVVGARQRCRR